MVHWQTPSANNLVSALKQAFPRFLLGLAGSWCALGTIFLLFGFWSISWIITSISILSILLCYAGVYLTCVHLRWTPWKVLFLESGWAMSFIIIGELASDMMEFSETLRIVMVPVYTYTGFFLAELMKLNAHFTGTGQRLSQRFFQWLTRSR